jgi:hypothetical protein
LPANLSARQTELVLTNLSVRQTEMGVGKPLNATRRQGVNTPFNPANTPEEFFLYPEKIVTIPEEHIRDGAGNLIVAKVTNPTLTAFIPPGSNTNKAAVIICPGGGYTNLHIQREGF